ncbi:MAG: glycogen debranching enzyme GlgX, partial [Mesorhizobium sp.]
DGHNDNLSWNNGAEGETADEATNVARSNGRRALLATLFASHGTIMLTAGDEFGRTQQGNNNAYAQDNAITWLDWAGRDQALEQYTASLAALRRAFPVLANTHFLTGAPADGSEIADVAWLTETGMPLGDTDWNDAGRHRLVMLLGDTEDGRLAILVNGDRRQCVFTLPARDGFEWRPAVETQPVDLARPLPGRCVSFVIERQAAKARARKGS